MADPERLSELVEGDDGGIPVAAFKPAQILLTKARKFGNLLLCEPFILAQTREIPTDELAHIHAQIDGSLHTLMLSTIVC